MSEFTDYNDYYEDDENYVDVEKSTKNLRYAVAIYHDDGLAYGGPEEGGWWYDTGSLERVVAVVKSYEVACRICRRLNDRLYHIAKIQGIPSVSASNYSGGRYSADIHTCEDGKAFFVPAYYPDQRPHYE